MATNRRFFLKQIGLGAAGLSIAPSLQSFGNSSSIAKTTSSLPRSKPEEQGISSSGILEFLDEVQKSKIGFHSIMILRHGHVVAEGWWAPYGPALKHTLYSLSKSFTSSAVGFAVAEKRFTIDDKVISFFKEELPATVSDNLAAMKVRHLLTMTTGHVKDTMPPIREAKDASWSKTFLAQPVEREPGSFFLYNTGASYMLSAIVQKRTGQPVIEYLKPRLFEPLGIEGMDWESNAQGVNVGGYGLRVKTEDIAKLGQLYLQKGTWKGKQLLPASWVEEATRKQVNSNPSSADYSADNDWAQGYGYQFWRCSTGGFRADGAFGQFSIVLPEYDAVVAVTSESFNMGASMKLIWNYLLPAMKQAPTTSADESIQKKTKERLKNLSLDLPNGSISSPVVQRISGKSFQIDNNEFKVASLSFMFRNDSCVFTVKDDKGEHRVECGLNIWTDQNKPMVLFSVPGRTDVSTKVSASAIWTNENTLVIMERFTETAHGDQLTCTFEGDQLDVKFLNSVANGNPNNGEKRANLKGRTMA
ncbi:MAG TPA: serine hydrolase [Cyclobacteriaceae bacterium]|nr:serine hydrolase [Cyclobacteriaceae bacterium]